MSKAKISDRDCHECGGAVDVGEAFCGHCGALWQTPDDAARHRMARLRTAAEIFAGLYVVIALVIYST